MISDNPKIIIFCKAPVPGFVKTRLIPDVGEEVATSLHCELATRTIELCLTVEGVDCELWCAPDTSHAFYSKFDVPKVEQKGADLGERMSHALHTTLESSDTKTNSPRVVLIGTDCPNLTQEYLNQAIQMLDSYDVVLGPAEDGGYGLVGVSVPNSDMFKDITWGTDQVCTQTCRRLNTQGINYGLLSLLWDVDRIADYHRYRSFITPLDKL